jgi:hypothetical protein
MKEHFKGDIIITDPRYIVDDESDWLKCLRSAYRCDMGVIGMGTWLASSTGYGDWSCTTFDSDKCEEGIFGDLQELYFDTFSQYNDSSISANEKECLMREYELKMDKIAGPGAILGEFCADTSLVGVFLLSEVLKYNPNFDYHIKRPWTTTLIKDFDGHVEIISDDGGVHVVGTGNINFKTEQTGL